MQSAMRTSYRTSASRCPGKRWSKDICWEPSDINHGVWQHCAVCAIACGSTVPCAACRSNSVLCSLMRLASTPLAFGGRPAARTTRATASSSNGELMSNSLSVR
eukprot:9096659-Pyramimonas_sp.AAC.1